MKARWAERANYWQTSVHPAKSQAEIIARLEDFGTSNLAIIQGQANGRVAWAVRFGWQGRSYRFLFTPLECEYPDKLASFGSRRRTHAEQARYQMGRIAVHFTKAVLTAAEASPDALFGFLELPSGGSMPMTAAELDVSGVVSLLPEPAIEGSYQLLSGEE